MMMIIVPSFQELTVLAAIVGIKIVIGWTLSKELNRQYYDQHAKSGIHEMGGDLIEIVRIGPLRRTHYYYTITSSNAREICFKKLSVGSQGSQAALRGFQ
jgi:hypothetical protein